MKSRARWTVAGSAADGIRLESLNLVIEEQQIETIGRPQRPQQALQRLIAALQLLPLHGQARIEQDDQSLGRAGGHASTRARSRAFAISEQGFGLEKSRFVIAADGSSFGGRGLSALRISVGQHMQTCRRRQRRGHR